MDIYKDFEEATIADYNAGHLYGLEKYWAYHYYRPDKNTNTLPVHDDLKEALTKYKSLEDFKIKKWEELRTRKKKRKKKYKRKKKKKKKVIFKSYHQFQKNHIN